MESFFNAGRQRFNPYSMDVIPLAVTQDYSGALWALRNVYSLTAVGIVITTYDFLLTLADEIELVWKSKSSAIKWLFLLNRYPQFVEFLILLYYGVQDGEAPHHCSAAYHALAWMQVVGMGVSEVLFTLRTWAVWGKARNLGVILTVAFVLSWAAISTLMGMYLSSISWVLPLQHDQRCTNTYKNRHLMTIMWSVALAYDTGILLLMLWHRFSLPFSGRPGKLEKAVYTTGVTYYLILFALTGVNVIIMPLLPWHYANLLTVLDRQMYSILACRAILHIRKEGQQTPTQFLITDPVFSQGPANFSFVTCEDSRSSVSILNDEAELPTIGGARHRDRVYSLATTNTRNRGLPEFLLGAFASGQGCPARNIVP